MSGSRNFSRGRGPGRVKPQTNETDTGYSHDGRADKDSYPHDGRADKDSYPHDGRADKNPYPHDRHKQCIMLSL